jgi:SAM-dependent methyltransferase
VTTKAPPFLHPGASEHYVDASAYELRYRDRIEDVSYYVARCKRLRSVLEYGAGAGRLTLLLAQRGIDVTAVEISPNMIELLRQRREQLPPSAAGRIEIRPADMRSFRTKKRFDAVVAAFHTVCHLYSFDDVRSFFHLAFSHLRPGGTLEFDLPLPRIDMPEYDPLAQVRVTEVDGPSGPQLLTQRWFQPQEIAMHVAYAGFERIRLCSDFTSRPIDGDTSIFTISARRPQDAD